MAFLTVVALTVFRRALVNEVVAKIRAIGIGGLVHECGGQESSIRGPTRDPTLNHDGKVLYCSVAFLVPLAPSVHDACTLQGVHLRGCILTAVV